MYIKEVTPMEQSIKPMRRSNFELLRIIAMLMIVVFHFSLHTDFVFAADRLSVSKAWIYLLRMGGKIGVDIFVMISGYFLVNKSGISLSKTVKLWLQIAFYSVGIYLLFAATGAVPFGIKTAAKSCFPIMTDQWWFASGYFVLYLLSPYINKLLHALSKAQYQKMLIVLLTLWCLLPTVTNRFFGSNDLIWFVTLYAVAGYVRLWGEDIKLSARKCILTAVVIAAVTYAAVLAVELVGMKTGFMKDRATELYGMERLPIFLISLLLLLGFERIDIKPSKFINTVSSATFGVYLIHDSDLVRPFLWDEVVRGAKYSDSLLLIPLAVASALAIYVICTAIELIRIKLLEDNYMKLIRKADNFLHKITSGYFKVISSAAGRYFSNKQPK